VTQLSDQLQTIVLRHKSKPALFESLLQLLLQQTNMVGGVVLVQGPNNTLRLGPHRFQSQELNAAKLGTWLAEELHRAGAISKLHVARPKSNQHLAAIFAPLRMGEHVTFVALAQSPDQSRSLTTEIAITQLFTAYAGRWQEQQGTAQLTQQLSSTAAILELVSRIESSGDLKSACFTVVAMLQKHLGCERVVIGLRQKKHMCRVRAVSGLAEVDDNAELTRKLQAVLNEACLRDQVSAWPLLPGNSPHQLLAHKQLARRDASVISTPLKTRCGEPIGALAMEGRRELAAMPVILNFLAALSEPLGSALQAAKRTEGSWPQRCLRSVLAPRKTQQRWSAVGLLMFLVAVLLVPVTYRIPGRCVTEPVERRFCVAPHDGLLENTFAEPGDVVSKGHLLARMDGREIRWELAGTQAEMHRAAKQRDTHMAHHETSEALLAELEMKRLDCHSQLLRFREGNLELTSSTAGIVLSGSLDRRENYPVSKGQLLYEIAPLHPLRVELAVPADEVAHLHRGMPAHLKLEGLNDQIVGKVDKIRPRAEVRDDQNVFIAEVLIDNTAGQIRPGMKGRGKIVSDAKSIGWIIFHRAWERIVIAWPW
jgi:multidrug efflux pump subunit AcrA (membrane-fusion protein)